MACKRLSLSEALEELEYRIFYQCTSLEKAEFGTQLRTIWEAAFQNSGLKEVSFHAEDPGSPLVIHDGAFLNCGQLQKVTFLGDNYTCSPGAFKGTPWLSEQGPLVIRGKELFCYQGTDREVKLPEGIERIGKAAFSHCDSLVSVELPEGLWEIGYAAFSLRRNLTDVRFPKGMEKIGDHAFRDRRSLKKLILPDSVTCIGEEAFACCSSFFRAVNHWRRF